jgi:Tol biopolymer transport system component
MKKLLLAYLILFAAFASVAQTVLENNPPSVKWYQLNSPHFRVIYPKGFETQAQRVANTLDHIWESEAKTLGSAPKKISLILQNQSAVSNAFVSVLPRRSEFYTMPPQDYNFVGANDWLNMLATHEYRHVVQYQHALQGFNKFLYYAFGATTYAGMAQAAVPDWFWEGDAVATETAFLPTGRGKIPEFSLAFRTNLLEGREFNYHKQYLRSYKHFVPDEYVLGYHMVSYLRKRTNDPEIWGKITKRAWSVPFIPFAFSSAIKKETGLHVTDLYKEMVKDFKKEWQEKVSQLELTPFEKVMSRKNKAYTDYLYPQPQPDGSIIALKRGIGDIESFVRINDQKEKKIFTPGFVNEAGMLSAINGRIIWNEFGFNPRRVVKTFSLIKYVDSNRRTRKVTGSNKERYTSAALSPDASQVATIYNGIDYTFSIRILAVSSGRVIRNFENTDNFFYSMPRWSDDGKQIVVLKTTPTGKTISLADVESGVVTDVTSPSNENVGHPIVQGDYLLFNSPISGIDNIYAIRLSTKERFKITTSRHGAYNPAISADGQYIYYNDQTKDGMDIVRIPFDPSKWQPFTNLTEGVNSYEHLVQQENASDILNSLPHREYEPRRFSKLKGMINPYTWGLNVESDLSKAIVGISSKDLLSTVALDAGYEFDINERTGSLFARASYQNWFPIIDITARYGKRSVSEGLIPVLEGTDIVSRKLRFEWIEKTIEGGLRIPLNITNGKFSSNLTFSNYVGLTLVSDFENSINGGGRLIPAPEAGMFYLFRDYVDQGSLVYNHFSFSLARLLKQNRRDINSKWGQVINIDFHKTLEGLAEYGDYSGSQFSIYGVGYFPGFAKHHSIWGYWAYQKTDIKNEVDNYFFRNGIPLPRGQSVSRNEKMYSMSANYMMPVWYPDIALGPLVNFQRLRANGFFDYSFGSSQLSKTNSQYTSVGVEAKLDLNIMRFYPQFDIGVRYTRGLSPATSQIEFLLGTFNF